MQCMSVWVACRSTQSPAAAWKAKGRKKLKSAGQSRCRKVGVQEAVIALEPKTQMTLAQPSVLYRTGVKAVLLLNVWEKGWCRTPSELRSSPVVKKAHRFVHHPYASGQNHLGHTISFPKEQGDHTLCGWGESVLAASTGCTYTSAAEQPGSLWKQHADSQDFWC